MQRVENIVVGRNGMIGSALFRALARRRTGLVGTSRRASNTNDEPTIRLDLSTVEPGMDYGLPIADVAFLCAAISGFANCSSDPVGTARVNVAGTVALAKSLLANGTHIVFLSTSAVFDGNQPSPAEWAPASPSTEYGRQKLLAETQLMEAAERCGRGLAIVRLTKVLSASQPLIRQFRESLVSGVVVEAFEDLLLSPISLDHVVASITELAAKRLTGIFHLSGESQVSYAELAVRMATAMRVNPDLVVPVRSAERGVIPVFAPAFATLGMSRTTAMSGLHPQCINEAIAALLINS